MDNHSQLIITHKSLLKSILSIPGSGTTNTVPKQKISNTNMTVKCGNKTIKVSKKLMKTPETFANMYNIYNINKYDLYNYLFIIIFIFLLLVLFKKKY